MILFCSLSGTSLEEGPGIPGQDLLSEEANLEKLTKTLLLFNSNRGPSLEDDIQS